MPELVRRLPWPPDDVDEPDLLQSEWLVTNGLGGYASGTVAALSRAATMDCWSRRCRRRLDGWCSSVTCGSVYGCPTVPS